MKFENKEQVVDALVSKWNCKHESFYNIKGNQSKEEHWTFKNTLDYLMKLEKDYFITINGSRAHNNLKGILASKQKQYMKVGDKVTCLKYPGTWTLVWYREGDTTCAIQNYQYRYLVNVSSLKKEALD